jgi:hypothetical protein
MMMMLEVKFYFFCGQFGEFVFGETRISVFWGEIIFDSGWCLGVEMIFVFGRLRLVAVLFLMPIQLALLIAQG